MIIAVVDVETTGTDRDADRIIQSAVAAFHVETRSVLSLFSSIDPRVSVNPAAEINKITPEMLAAARSGPGVDPLLLLRKWSEAKWISAVVAHNATFDLDFIARSHAYAGAELDTPWICTFKDFAWGARASHKLAHLAVDHGIWLPPALAHSAHGDVLALCGVLASRDDLEAQIERAMKPHATFEACVSFRDKDYAKERGFGWNPDQKRWEKRMPADTPLDPTPDRPFKVRIVT